MQPASGEIDRDDSAAGAIFHHQVDGEVLDKEFCVVLERLLIERVQHCVPGTVSCRAGSLCGALSVTRRHAAEGSLVNPAIFSP